jgi:hypothetical protein
VGGELEAIGQEGVGLYDPRAGTQVLLVDGPDYRSVGAVGPVERLVDPTIGEERADGTVPNEHAPVELLPNA